MHSTPPLLFTHHHCTPYTAQHHPTPHSIHSCNQRTQRTDTQLFQTSISCRVSMLVMAVTTDRRLQLGDSSLHQSMDISKTPQLVHRFRGQCRSLLIPTGLYIPRVDLPFSARSITKQNETDPALECICTYCSVAAALTGAGAREYLETEASAQVWSFDHRWPPTGAASMGAG